MPKYDAENLIADIETDLKAYLNAKIAALTTEKGDGLELLTVNNAAYVFQTENDQVINHNPFIYFELSDPEEIVGVGPATAKKYVVTVVLLVIDNGQDQLIGKRLLRYSRALEEVFEDRWDKIGNALKLKVRSLSPSPYRYAFANSSEEYRAVAIQVEASLA